MTEANKTRIKIKLPNLEVEYEGTPNFLESGLLELTKKFGDFAKEEVSQLPLRDNQDDDTKTHEVHSSLTTIAIANRLGTKSGPELIIATMAKLKFTDGKDVVSADDIKTEMKEAHSIYKKSMTSNFDKNITNLVKQEMVNVVAAKRYSLSRKKIESIEKQIDFSA